MRLFKDDSRRAIDQIIDFFGEPSFGNDMCGELALEMLCRDAEALFAPDGREEPAATA